MSRTLEIFTDGACSGNPGEASIGIVILEQGKKIKELAKPIGQATNNIAEYTACLCAFEEARVLKADQIALYTDSELMFKQLTGQYEVKNVSLKLLFDQIQQLAQGFKRIDIKHIPREKNQDADQLATQVLKKKQAKVVAPLFHHSGEESPSSKG